MLIDSEKLRKLLLYALPKSQVHLAIESDSGLMVRPPVTCSSDGVAGNAPPSPPGDAPREPKSLASSLK